MPETHDLDQLFADLTARVTRTSSPRGARGAIRTARRRRTAVGVGAVACVTALVVGVGSQVGLPGLGDDARGPDVAAERPALLAPPEPAALDAAAMDAATSGWLEPGWTEQDSPVLADPPCVDEEAPIPNPSGGTTNSELRLGKDVGATFTVAIFDAIPDAVTAFDLLADPGTCAASAQQVPLADDLTRATVLRVPASDGNPPSTVWVVRDGSMLGLLTVAGASAQPSPEVSDRVALAAMAAVPYNDLRAGLPGGPTEVPADPS